MTDHTCLACGLEHPDARDVTLHDGRVVSSYSEDWQHECEAVSVISLPCAIDRRQHLDRVQKRRGKPAADALRATVRLLWNKQQRFDSRAATI